MIRFDNPVIAVYAEICQIVRELEIENIPATEENISLAWSIADGGEDVLEVMQEEKLLNFDGQVWRLTPIGEEFVL